MSKEYPFGATSRAVQKYLIQLDMLPIQSLYIN